jgi:hypothetical protein
MYTELQYPYTFLFNHWNTPWLFPKNFSQTEEMVIILIKLHAKKYKAL